MLDGEPEGKKLAENSPQGELDAAFLRFLKRIDHNYKDAVRIEFEKMTKKRQGNRK